MKSKINFFPIIFICIISSVFSGTAQCTLDKSNWTLTFNEEFNTDLEDLKLRWNIFTGPNPWAHNKLYRSINKEENIVLNNGLAFFETQKLPSPIIIDGLEYKYSTGMMVSKIDEIPHCSSYSDAGYLYGMFEIRCKFPKKHGQYPAYWLYGDKSWPPEIDVFEFNGHAHDQFFTAIYWGQNNDPQSCGNMYHFPFDITDDFHTWTMVWTPTQVTWFFDNKELKTDNNLHRVPGATSPNMWERCRWRKMNHQIGCDINNPIESETEFDPLIVDYIRIYKPIGYLPYSSGDFNYWHDDIVEPLYANTPYKSNQDWLLKKIHPAPENDYNSYSDMNVLQGGGKYFYKGDYHLLWNTYWYDYGNGGQFYSAPFDWNYPIDGYIDVASDNEIPFFRKSLQLHYYQNGAFHKIKSSSFPFGSLNNIGNKIIANDNGLQVFYLGLDNNIYECKRNSLFSHTWVTKKITNTNNISDEIIFDQNNNILYFRNTSNQLKMMIYIGSSWFSTTISSINDVHSSLHLSPFGERIYYKTSSNQLVYYQKTGTFSWIRNQFNAISPYSNGNSVWINNVKGDICVAENPHQIYYIGLDNRIWVVYWDGAAWYNTPINWNVNYVKNDLRITNPTTSHKRLCFVGDDNKIRYFQWDICENTNPPCGSHEYFRKAGGHNVVTYTNGVENTYIKNNQSNHIDSSGSQEILIFPNPAENKIMFTGSYNDSDYYVVSIFDAKGVFISSSQLILNSYIDISNLPHGFYIAKIMGKDSSHTLKFIKKQ